MKKFIVILFVLIALVGCNSAPTLDGSSNEAFLASVGQVSETLTADQQENLGKSIIGLSFYAAVEGISEEVLLKTLDGMTYDELTVYAEKTLKEQ